MQDSRPSGQVQPHGPSPWGHNRPQSQAVPVSGPTGSSSPNWAVGSGLSTAPASSALPSPPGATIDRQVLEERLVWVGCVWDWKQTQDSSQGSHATSAVTQCCSSPMLGYKFQGLMDDIIVSVTILRASQSPHLHLSEPPLT
jgi:hypothetical protein